MNLPRLLAMAIVLVAMAAGIRAEETATFAPEQIEFFEKKIRPLLVEQCYKCHSAEGEKIKGGLWLDSRAGILKGGDSGPSVVPGVPDKSLLIAAIRYTDEDLQMPPKHRLKPEQVKDFEEWVRIGLPDPRDDSEPAKPRYDWEQARKFWSFQPVQNPIAPAVEDGAWPRNEVDRFLLAQIEAKGLKPNPDIDRSALLRRATFDLIGLPPTPEEMRAFLDDRSTDAFAKVVDRLLASPHYGEQWGRHWLDIVRYADTSGCNSDFPVPSAFRYRNYVIDAFNRDKPYDQFLREQIAGDLLPAATNDEHLEKTVATGYLAVARRFGSRANEFHLTVEDLIDNLGKAMVGLSLGCARCHDHKFDPVPTRDYYALYGIFESSKFAFPGTEVYRHTKDFIPLVTGFEAEKFKADSLELAALDDRIENLKNEKRRLVREEKAAAQKAAIEPPPPPGIPSELPGQPPQVEKPKRSAYDVGEDLEDSKERVAEVEKRIENVPKIYAVSEGKPTDAYLQEKGDPTSKGDVVPRGFLTILGGQQLPADEKGSGRKELAEWLTDRANPLTARVMVNRIWQHHFGRGLVKTPNDFGVRGERPTHPELLDWLANRFLESGWSVKAMHRLIMLARAYQMSSDDNPAGSAKDPANDLLSRFNRRRLGAEEIRDSILAVSGKLDHEPGGPHPFPPEGNWRYTQHKPFVANYESNKRTIYQMQQRIRKHPFLEIFDGADTNATTPVRTASTTPIQALWMMNNQFAHEQALAFADRIYATAFDESARLSLAHELSLARSPAVDELRIAREYLAQVADVLRDTGLPADQQPRAALASFARVLFSSNEFLFVE